MFHLKSSPLRSMWKIQDCSSGPVFMRGSDMVPRTGPAVQSRRTVRQSFIPERLRTSCCEGNAIGKVSGKTSDHRCKLLPSFSLRGVKLLPSRRQLCLHQLRGDFPRKWCGSDLSRPASHEGSSDFATRPEARLAGSFLPWPSVVPFSQKPLAGWVLVYVFLPAGERSQKDVAVDRKSLLAKRTRPRRRVDGLGSSRCRVFTGRRGRVHGDGWRSSRCRAFAGGRGLGRGYGVVWFLACLRLSFQHGLPFCFGAPVIRHFALCCPESLTF